ncbi:hypothetical protein [Flavobacterium laiguense]|uniref:Uncharacterized protein n=1 Tax=Flavobacterium laiguense TaxID=2169409 RepID=A0A2U1JWE6_9FLAO|nr:hypothetical protein [Flavobacterium laiguense]PWA09526.1 hypothetical protein DB891_07540 [Flavobacterium laiguense]
MILKQLNYIRTKKELQNLYLSQMSERVLIDEINDILRETRTSVSMGMRHFAKNLLTHEVIIFIKRNGTPDGYLLSEELKIKLKEYEESLMNQKQLEWKFEKAKICNTI